MSPKIPIIIGSSLLGGVLITGSSTLGYINGYFSDDNPKVLGEYLWINKENDKNCFMIEKDLTEVGKNPIPCNTKWTKSKVWKENSIRENQEEDKWDLWIRGDTDKVRESEKNPTSWIGEFATKIFINGKYSEDEAKKLLNNNCSIIDRVENSPIELKCVNLVKVKLTPEK